jgi:hypothetical protein
MTVFAPTTSASLNYRERACLYADAHDDVVARRLEFESEERAALALAGRQVTSGGFGVAWENQVQSRRFGALHCQHMGEQVVELRDAYRTLGSWQRARVRCPVVGDGNKSTIDPLA